MRLKPDYHIIADFLNSSIKERMMYELSSPKKRIKAFERLSHNIESAIKLDHIYYRGNVNNEAVKAEIQKNIQECIVLSLEYQQGISMSIDEALDYLNDSFFAVIVNENWMIIKPEYEGGKESVYILRK